MRDTESHSLSNINLRQHRLILSKCVGSTTKGCSIFFSSLSRAWLVMIQTSLPELPALKLYGSGRFGSDSEGRENGEGGGKGNYLSITPKILTALKRRGVEKISDHTREARRCQEKHWFITTHLHCSLLTFWSSFWP